MRWWTEGIGFDLRWGRLWLFVVMSEFDDLIEVHTNKGHDYSLVIAIGPLFVAVGLTRKRI